MAKRRRLSDNRVLVELIEEGIEAQKRKENAFFELAERFRASKDPEEVKRLGAKFGHFVFGNTTNPQECHPEASRFHQRGEGSRAQQHRMV